MPPQHHSHVRGILYLLGAASTFALLDASSKWLAQFYPVPMVVWARYLAHTLLMVVWLGPRLGLNLVRSHQPRMQIVRGLVLLSVSMVFLLSLSLMPIAEATAISFMSPLLLTMLSVVVLREYVPHGAWMAVFAGFLGVVIIIRPGGELFSPVVLLPLGSALLFATYQLLTRKMAGIDATMTTLFYGALVGTVLLSFFTPLFWVAPQSYLHGFVFLLAGVLGGAGHLFLIRAFEYTPASVLAPFMYWQLVVAAGVGLLVFDTFPDGWSLTGMVIIVLSGVWVAMHRRN
jgi:drug/metabolite transporter (DMT)-like permease